MSDYNPITSRCWTREMAASSVNETPNNTFPKFDLSQIKPLMSGYNIWDAWFVLDEESGQIANINGYRMLVALGCKISTSDTRMMYFLSLDGIHYKACGRLLSEGNKFIDQHLGTNQQLLPEGEEWSGSSIYRKNRHIQTFYTLASSFQSQGIWQKEQQIAMVTQALVFEKYGSTDEGVVNLEEIPNGSEFTLHIITHEILLNSKDSVYYQTPEQASQYEHDHPTKHNWEIGDDQTNNFCFRDPKFIKVKGTLSDAYLLIEANTRSVNGAFSFDDQNTLEGSIDKGFIGSDEFSQHDVLTPDAQKANACIGMLSLFNPAPSDTLPGSRVKYSSRPYDWGKIFFANLVTDEIERINLIEHEDHYFLFFTTHSNKMAFNGENMINRDMMIGFRSKKTVNEHVDVANPNQYFHTLHLEKAEWIPLNGNGVVIQQKSPGPRFSGQDHNPQYVYSWMVLPDLTVLCYSNFSTDKNGNVQPVKTMGPSIKLEIEGTTTRINPEPIYNFKPID